MGRFSNQLPSGVVKSIIGFELTQNLDKDRIRS